MRAALEDIGRTVAGVEKCLAENEGVVKGNIRGLEEKIEDLGRRVESTKVGLST